MKRLRRHECKVFRHCYNIFKNAGDPNIYATRSCTTPVKPSSTRGVWEKLISIIEVNSVFFLFMAFFMPPWLGDVKGFNGLCPLSSNIANSVLAELWTLPKTALDLVKRCQWFLFAAKWGHVESEKYWYLDVQACLRCIIRGLWSEIITNEDLRRRTG